MSETEELLQGDDPRHAKIRGLVDGFFLAAEVLQVESSLQLTAVAVIIAHFNYGLNDGDREKVWMFLRDSSDQNILLMEKHNAGRAN